MWTGSAASVDDSLVVIICGRGLRGAEGLQLTGVGSWLIRSCYVGTWGALVKVAGRWVYSPSPSDRSPHCGHILLRSVNAVLPS